MGPAESMFSRASLSRGKELQEPNVSKSDRGHVVSGGCSHKKILEKPQLAIGSEPGLSA